MPRNSIGVYIPPSSTWNPANPSTPISSTDWNALLSDMADALTGSLAANGTTPVTGEFFFPYGITGPVTGNVTGNLTGNVTGNLTGNGAGAWTGPVVGNVTGNITGNGAGAWTGPVTGDVTGNVSGSSGSCTGNAATATLAASATTATTATTASTGSAGFTISGLRGARVFTGSGSNTGLIVWSTSAPGVLDDGQIWLQHA